MATLFKTDGTSKVVYPRGKMFSLEELQAFVGGYIEEINLVGDEKNFLIVNEEGKLKHLPCNPHFAGSTVIVGDVLLLSKTEMG